MLLSARHVERSARTLLRRVLTLLLTSAMFAGVLLSAATATAEQDDYADQWNVRGTAEEEQARFESMIRPTRHNERIISDRLDDEERASAADRSASGRSRIRSGTQSSGSDRTTTFSSFEDELRRASSAEPLFGEPNEAEGGLREPAEPMPDRSAALANSPRIPDDWNSGASRPTLTPEVVFRELPRSEPDGWHMMPAGLLYRSYLAGEKEPRMQFAPLRDYKNDETYWEAVLGGRVGIIRNGTGGAQDPQGFQVDLEGAVFARVLPNEPSAALAGSDYRAGILATWREDQTAYKAGYYHVSSHVGDEYLLLNPGFTRINYVRDSLIAGTVRDLSPESRVYGELAYALGMQGGAEPLELQFGAEYTPQTQRRWGGAPYAAVNGHIREEFDFNTGFNFVSGWNWQSRQTGHRLRFGMQYYNGPSLQYQFFDRWESLLGGGLWFDY